MRDEVERYMRSRSLDEVLGPRSRDDILRPSVRTSIDWTAWRGEKTSVANSAHEIASDLKLGVKLTQRR